MIKVAGDYPFEAYKNCFLNLAIPIIVFTETSEVRKTEIRYVLKVSFSSQVTFFYLLKNIMLFTYLFHYLPPHTDM